MLRSRKLVKSYPKSLFAYQTNRSGDSYERYEAYNSSSSSETLSSDQLSGSSLNSSTSSLITSSDNSSEFNEVEQVIEEYFLRKLARNSDFQPKNVSIMKSISERKDRSTTSIDVGKCRSLKSCALLCESSSWKNNLISSAEVGTQVSHSDFKKVCLVNREKRNIRSKSFNFSHHSGLWIFHKNFKAYLNKTVMDMDLCFLFQNSFALIPNFCKTLRYTEGADRGSSISSKLVFKDYFSRFKFPTLSMSIDHISPFKSMLLLDQKSSKILLFNERAKLLFRLKDSKFSQFFDTFLIDEFKYANLVHHFVDTDGKICYLPAQMVLCRDSNGYNFYAMVRFQKIKVDCNYESGADPIILVIEPLIMDSGICIHDDDRIIAFNCAFINILQLHKMKEENIFDDIFYRLMTSKCYLCEHSSSTNAQEVKHNILKFTNQELPFHFLSVSNSITEVDARLYKKIFNLRTSHCHTIKGDLHATRLWFFSNLSCVLTISLFGKIIGCNPYFNFLVGYSSTELLTIDINDILKFNSFEFDAMLLLEKGNGKYDATLSHLNGSRVRSMVWVYKEEDTVGTGFYTLWFITDVKEYTFPSTIHPQSQTHEGSYVNLDTLLCDFHFEGVDKLTINKKNDTNVKDIAKVLKKAKSLSLPEARNYNDLKLSPWSFITTVDGKESNTSSEISEHFKDVSANKDVDIFHNDYHILNIIGKGAFGFVRLATSTSNNEEFVIKFIRKNKLAIEHMVKSLVTDVNKSDRRAKLINGYEETSEDKIMKTRNVDKDETFILIPREIWMLCQLSHENIVSLHDWYEGADHYQMIMPKHGVGMDLFEFIDRSPLLDEVLVSHIFRQLASAVSYLHNLMISHRDIKDENIILDDVFKIKLIDFGAAVKVEPEQKFKTFCGTMEFCSPEILLGQEYNCFHADIWSMGITLYTIMFGENPFYDFEETINAVLKTPKVISTDLFQLLSMLLEPNPLLRITADDLTKHAWLTQNVDITKYSFHDIVPNSVFCGNMASDFRKYSVDSNCEMIERKSSEVWRSKETINQESY